MKQQERKAANDRIESERAKVRAIVAMGKCPICGAGLRRNMSMSGWWQCSQLGAVGFRANPNLDSCSWQGFTQ